MARNSITLAEYAKRTKRRAQKVEFNANRLKQEYAKNCGREIIVETPVDTGLHTARWQARLNHRPEFSEVFIEGSDGSTKQANNALAIAGINDVIRTARYGDTIFVSNNGIVITMLNDGWSQQAPTGYIQAAILRGVTQTRGKFRLVEP